MASQLQDDRSREQLHQGADQMVRSTDQTTTRTAQMRTVLKKTSSVRVPVDEEELNKLRELARAAKLPLAAYLRRQGLC